MSAAVADSASQPPVQRSIWSRITSSRREDVRWRLTGLFCLTYVPLVVLAALRGLGHGGVWSVLIDYAVAIRFLVAVPLLVGAETFTRVRVGELCNDLVASGLVPPREVPAFREMIATFYRRRDIPILRLVAAIVVVGVNAYTGGTFVGAEPSWQFVSGAPGGAFTAAGWWCTLISVPALQFLLLFWLWRYILWCWFLFRVSRLDLALVPTHPDRAAGLTPIGYVHRYYGAVVFAFSAVLSGHIAVDLLGGADWMAYRVELVAFVALSLILLFVPLFVFTPKLIRTRRRGIVEYGALAARYTREFDRKWLHSEAPPEEPLIGTADIQSLADLANSVAIVHDMRFVPFDLRTIATIVVFAMIPLTPLAFFVYPPIEVLKGLAGLLL